MATQSSTETPTVTGTDDVPLTRPVLKKELSINTPGWEERAKAEEAEADERRRQSEMFKQEVVRQSSLLGATMPKDLADLVGSGMEMEEAEGDDDGDDDADMEEAPPAKEAPPAAGDQKEDDAPKPMAAAPKPHKQKSVTFMQEDDEKTKGKPVADDPLNGCYERVSDRTLGSGAYGVVSKVKCTKVTGNSRAKVGDEYALKKIRNVFRNRTDAKRILRELCILRDMRHHDCIVRVIDILVPNNLKEFKDLYVVFELIDTDMARVFSSDQNFKLLHVKYFLYQILRALLYMHSANLVHRDLKPANVLVNEDCSLRVADFGLSRCITEIPKVARGEWLAGKQLRKQLTQHMQTRWYRAPEVCLLEQRRETQFAMDIWGCGCIMGELLQMTLENQANYRERRALFRGSWSQKYSPRRKGVSDPENSQIGRIVQVVGTPTAEDTNNFGDKALEILKAINKKGPHTKVDWAAKFPGTPPDGLDMLDKMLRFDPRKRLTIEQCLAHPFMAEVRQSVDELKLQKVAYEFEDMNIESHLIRSLIIEELKFYHPKIGSKAKGALT